MVKPILNYQYDNDGNLFLRVEDVQHGTFWIPENEMDPQTLNEYMKNKSPSHKYYTRSKTRKFPFLLSILCFLMFLGISAASYTNSSISLITKGKAIRSVDLGSVFLCDKNKNLGLYGYPKVDFVVRNILLSRLNSWALYYNTLKDRPK